MSITNQKIPEVHSLIARFLGENGGSFQGTDQICEAIPAARQCVQRSLRKASKYQLFRRLKTGDCGRGHKTTWTLTRKGRQYVQS